MRGDFLRGVEGGKSIWISFGCKWDLVPLILNFETSPKIQLQDANLETCWNEKRHWWHLSNHSIFKIHVLFNEPRGKKGIAAYRTTASREARNTTPYHWIHLTSIFDSLKTIPPVGWNMYIYICVCVRVYLFLSIFMYIIWSLQVFAIIVFSRFLSTSPMLVARSWPDLWMKDSKDEKMGDAITTFLQEEAGRLKHIQDVTQKHRDLCRKYYLLVTVVMMHERGATTFN